MSPRLVRLTRVVIRCYPRRWRERYADEVLALVDDVGVSWRGVIDLARGAMRERAIDLDLLMFAWCHPAELAVTRRYAGRFLIMIGAALVAPAVIAGAAEGLVATGVEIPEAVETSLWWLRFLVYARLLQAAVALWSVGLLRAIVFGQRPTWPRPTALTCAGPLELAFWTAGFLAFETVQAAGHPGGTEWRSLFISSGSFFPAWFFYYRGFVLDMLELVRISLARRREEVRRIGLEEPYPLGLVDSTSGVSDDR